MKPPYRVLDFVASSGNSCRMKVWQNTDSRPARIAVDASWENMPTDVEMAEASKRVHEVLQESHPETLIRQPINIKMKDADDRERAIKSIILEDHELRNN